jgi:hypothetical protein
MSNRVIKHQCAHCMAQDIALSVIAFTPVYYNADTDQSQAVAHLRCPQCSMPSAARLMADPDKKQKFSGISVIDGDPTYSGWFLTGFWPEAPKPSIPEHLPPDIERIYLQAERNFPTQGNEEAAGTMYRKALDVGLKKIDPTLSGTLGAKLKQLSKNGRLLPDIAEWADHVRELGNDAAHEEDALPRKDLEDLRGITEMVLRSLFTLPNMTKKRRGEKLSWET